MLIQPNSSVTRLQFNDVIDTVIVVCNAYNLATNGYSNGRSVGCRVVLALLRRTVKLVGDAACVPLPQLLFLKNLADCCQLTYSRKLSCNATGVVPFQHYPGYQHKNDCLKPMIFKP